MRGLVIASAWLCSMYAAAQWGDTSRAYDIQEKGKFVLNLDVRRQLVRGELVRFFGVRMGIQKKRHVFALGLYGLDEPLEASGAQLSGVWSDSVDVRTTFNYLGLTYERILLDTWRWQISVPVMAGAGNVPLSYRDSTGDFRLYKDYRVYPMEAGAKVSFKLFFWLYLQGGVGYRHVIGPTELVNPKYSGPTWSYGLSIKFGKIYRYAKDKLEERRERNDHEDGPP